MNLLSYVRCLLRFQMHVLIVCRYSCSSDFDMRISTHEQDFAGVRPTFDAAQSRDSRKVSFQIVSFSK